MKHLPQFRHFFQQLIHHPGLIRPVEANLGGLFLELHGPQERGQALADPVEKGLFLIALFPAFDLVPLLEHRVGGRRRAVAENVGMAADQFVADFARHVVEVETAGLGGEFTVKDDLQQQIAKLFPEVPVIRPLDRVHRFVGFLDQVGNQRLVGLLGIPRATARRPQAVHDRPQPGELHGGVRGVHHGGVGHG